SRGPQRAQDADLATTPNHADGDGVVNQKCADHQRNVAEDAQVPAEGPQHAAVLFAARTGLLELVARREYGTDLAFDLLEVLFRVDIDIDMVQVSVAGEGLLCLG